MPRAPIDLLNALSPRLARAAAVATLPHAAPSERTPLIELLLARLPSSPRMPQDLLPLARLWPELPADVRERLGAFELGSTVEALRSSANPSDRRAAAALIAERCLSFRTDWDGLLAWAFEAYPEHRVGSVLLAAASIAHQAGPALRALLADTRQPSHFPLRGAARGLPLPEQRARLVDWLGIPALAPVARDRLVRGGGPPDPDDIAALFHDAHRLHARRRLVEFQRLERTERLFDRDATAWLPAGSRRARVKLLATLVMPEARRVALLHATLTDPDEGSRLRAVLALRRLPASHATDEALADFALDPACAVAFPAAAALCDAPTRARRRSLAEAYHRLTRSPHSAVRNLARRAVARGRAASALASGPLIAPTEARLRLGRDRVALIADLRERLASPRTDERLAAIDLAQRLQVLAELRDMLIAQALGTDHRAAARALIALGHDPHEDAARVVIESLAHPDPRARASAFESLARHDPGHDAFEGAIHDDTPRVRAVSLRHLLRRDGPGFPGSHALAEMLADTRPAHRVSALWVVERVCVCQLMQRVLDMSARDPSTPARERAARVSFRLRERVRVSWTRRTGPPDSAAATKLRGIAVVVRPLQVAPQDAAA